MSKSKFVKGQMLAWSAFPGHGVSAIVVYEGDNDGQANIRTLYHVRDEKIIPCHEHAWAWTTYESLQDVKNFLKYQIELWKHNIEKAQKQMTVAEKMLSALAL